jgi:hypothetical protein
VKRKFDVGKLQDPKIQQEFKLEIKNRFQLLENLSTEDTDTIPVNDEWQQIHKIYIEVRDRPFDLKGGYGFLFRSEFFFRNLFFISSLNSCRIFGSCNLPTSNFSK